MKSSFDSAAQPPIFLMEMESTSQLHNYKSSAFIQNTNNIIIPIKKDHASSSSSFSSTYPKSLENKKDQLKSSADDPEISIFDAQKYFDETSPESDPKDERSPTSPSFSPPIIPLRTTIPRLSSLSSSSTATHHTRNYNRNYRARSFHATPTATHHTRNYNRNYRARSFHATPTASSEASWNSQTGLLSNPPGALPVTFSDDIVIHKEKIRGGGGGGSDSAKWFFGPKCPCSGKKSVQVKEKIQVPPTTNLYTKTEINENHDLVQRVQRELIPNNHQQLSSSSSHENHFPSNGFPHHRQEQLSGSVRRLSDGSGGFSFPILNNQPVAHELSANPFDDPPRESLEVFQPWEDKSVPRKTGGRGFGYPGSPISRVTATDDDMASDASSDLFEIESFSTQTTSYPMYFRRDLPEEAQNFHSNRRLAAGNSIYSCRRSMDEPMTPSVAPTECYEPSEASIDWSVTTAEGFDRQTVTNFSVSASEIDVAVTRRQAWVNSSGGGREEGRKKGNGGGLLLMSCRHEKAVSVGPQPVKCVAAAGGGPPAAVLPLMSSVRHVSSRGQNCNKPPVAARSNSARLSLAFAA